MIKCVVFSELLYIISSYEKGRCDPGRLWTYGYKRSLYSSLEAMETIVDAIFIRSIDVSQEELFRKVLKSKAFTNSDKKKFANLLQDDVEMSYKGYTYDEINQLMAKIIPLARSCLRKTNKENKRTIYYLLHAFHNLPRAYLGNQSVLFGNLMMPVSSETALEYANRDLAYLRFKL